MGAIIASLCGKNLKPCLMELGGKNCALVMDDADLEKAAAACAVGAFFHAGQICMSTDLVLVEKGVAERFREAFAKAAKAWEPAQVMVNSAGVEKSRGIRGQAVKNGAEVVHGDHEANEDSETKIRPLVLSGVEKGMDMYHVESFGPTAGLIVVENEEQAIGIMNQTDFGLSTSIFTMDLARALRLARQLDSGYVLFHPSFRGACNLNF